MTLITKALPFSILTVALVLSGCGNNNNNENSTSLIIPVDGYKEGSDMPKGTQPTGVQINTNVLAKSNQTHVDEGTAGYSKIIQDENEFASEFAKFHTKAVPSVDFTNQKVVVMFLGDQASNNESLTVIPAYDDGSEQINLIINHEKLALGCEVDDYNSISSVFVSVDTTKPIKIIEKDTIKTCNEDQINYQVLHQSEGAEAYNDDTPITAYEEVLTDQAQLDTEFAKFTDTIAPTINFSQQQVVMATMGTLGSGGYSISVEQVYDSNDETHVVLIKESPGSMCPATSVMTVPNIFIAVDSLKPIIIETIIKREDCA